MHIRNWKASQVRRGGSAPESEQDKVPMSHAKTYMSEVSRIAAAIPPKDVEALAQALAALRERGGRLFMLGVGGGAGNCSHAVNDFRKLCGIEAYCATDNVSELTARTNDEGWETVFAAWLETSRLNENDGVFVMSVGGGDLERNISANLVRALELARRRGAGIFGIVGRDGGYARKVGDAVVVVPKAHDDRVTPHTEAFQAVVWHCLVSHPDLQTKATTW